MKKTVPLILMVLAAFVCHGQTTTFGVKAGFNLSEQTHNNYVNDGQSLLTGFNAGGFIDVGFKNFSIQPGLFLTSWGEADQSKYVFRNPGNGGPGAIPSTTRLYYIELPVNFLYRARLAKGTDIHFGGGPYIAQGFAEHNVVGTSSDYSQTFSYDNPDFGFDAIVGVTVKRFLVDAGFSYGIANIDENAPQSSHNMAFSLSIGYIFK